MRSSAYLLMLAAAFTACKKDSDDECPAPMTGPASYPTASYAPYAAGSWWVYTGVNIAPGTGVETPNSMRDSIFVEGDTIIDGRSYAHLRGERFGLFGVDQWVGVDGPRLVEPNGNVLMDVTAVSDTIATGPGPFFPVDSTATVLKSQSLGLLTPAGIFVSDHARELVFYMQPGFTSPLFEADNYVQDIGIAMYSSFYASSGVRIEMRLADHHIEE
ncbi:MAG: hypothetical protein IPJ76_15745 [Flavobacteriales bacterium]|nr:MAG: hypothetical protein IPJ76_15745 [Flavobacteriales bacterium]